MRHDQRRSHLGAGLKIPDRYQSFAQLAAAETDGVDYAIRLLEHPSPVVVMAPHGGYIEPTTSLIATAIAAERYSLYCFEGLQSRHPHGDLHITSTRFDEPQALELLARSLVAVAIHGYLEQDAAAPVLLGGLDIPLIDVIAGELTAAGFPASTSGHRFPATNPANICNRTSRGAGVQLELPRTLRDRLRDDALALQSFAAAVTGAIEAYIPTI